jgi:hypothetical protein
MREYRSFIKRTEGCRGGPGCERESDELPEEALDNVFETAFGFELPGPVLGPLSALGIVHVAETAEQARPPADDIGPLIIRFE